MKTITVTDSHGTVIFRDPALDYYINEGYLTITSYVYEREQAFGHTKTLAVYAPGFWHNLEIK